MAGQGRRQMRFAVWPARRVKEEAILANDFRET